MLNILQDTTTLLQASEVAEKIKKRYHWGTSKCPKWLKSILISRKESGNYGIDVCIPSWRAISNEECESFLHRIDGVWVGLKVVEQEYDGRDCSIVNMSNTNNDDKVPITRVEKRE